MLVTWLYAFNLICENLLAALCGVALKIFILEMSIIITINALIFESVKLWVVIIKYKARRDFLSY